MTMLELIQQAVGEMGSGSIPQYVAGNQNQDTVQQLRLLNGLGSALMREFIWQDLNQTNIFTVQFTTLTGSTTLNSNAMTVSSTAAISNLYGLSGPGINQATYVNSVTAPSTVILSQPATSTNVNQSYSFSQVKFNMPADYDRIIDRTQWDKTKHWELMGPETPQQWEWLISGYISTGPRIRWRIFGNYFQIWPLTAANEVLGFEYIGNGWAFSAAGVPQKLFIADTDTCMYPDRLMIEALKHRYFEVKGFGDVYKAEYMRQLTIATGNDTGSAILSMAPKAAGILITQSNVQDSGYGMS